MPELRLVSASLWDLRTQCEQMMRALGDAQGVAEGYRVQPDSQTQMKARLQSDLRVIKEAHAIIGSALDDCARVIDALPVSEPSTR